jgi:hypothetical protein
MDALEVNVADEPDGPESAKLSRGRLGLVVSGRRTLAFLAYLRLTCDSNIAGGKSIW